MRNGPPRGLEWAWLNEEMDQLEETAKRMKHHSSTWHKRHAELMEWVSTSNGTLTVKQKSQARARLGRMTWSTQ